MPKPADIRPGQQFRASDGLLWEVDALSDLSTSIPHVKMVGVLRDQSRFQELPSTA
jgi:hypothetical protein